MGMYITGIGRTQFGILKESLVDLAKIAVERALTDAQMDIRDIGAIYVANFLAAPLERQLHLNALMADVLSVWGIPIVRIETACASGGAALQQAVIASKTYDTIVVVGMEKMTGNSKRAVEAIAMASDRQKDHINGLIFPAAYALIASHYMKRYRLTMRDLAEISLKNHRHATLNPYAQFYQKPVTMEEIMSSRIVASPLRLFDCSPISDGGCAIIISRKKRSVRDVRIAASSLSTGPLSMTNIRDFTTFPSAVKSAKEAYKQAGIGPKDIDLACVHDCFTIAEAVAMEDLGFCPRGEAKKLIRERKTYRDGALSINTHGGLKADGHPMGASGLAQIFELVTQLRHEAGERQISRARWALAHNIGGVGGTAVVHILSRQ
jgi:acetyl-CoA C-acetyltransferase